MFNSGSTIENIAPVDRRSDVVKFGRTTGLTKGSFQLDGMQVAVRDLRANIGTNNQVQLLFKRIYKVLSCGISDSFFQRGDSGSGVFLVDKEENLHCIGIAIGCTSYGTAVVEPIGLVLSASFGHLRPMTLKHFKEESIDER